MVNKIAMFEDSAGNVHRSEHDAHRADLALWFQRSDTMNEASAKQLADHIALDADRPSELIGMLEALDACAPHRTAGRVADQ